MPVLEIDELVFGGALFAFSFRNAAVADLGNLLQFAGAFGNVGLLLIAFDLLFAFKFWCLGR